MPRTWSPSVVASFVVLAVTACALDDDPTPDAGPVDAGGLDAGEDAGTDAGLDAGEDAGTDAGGDDAGTDAGSDAGITGLHEGPALSAPQELLSLAGVIDASHDEAGNLWAASSSHVFVRRAGLGAFESFGEGDGLSGDEILGVGGGVAGVAWVGHRGEGDGSDPAEPAYMRHTGGVDRVTLKGADVDVRHYELSSPPGRFAAYPDGRYKLRSCFRTYGVKHGARAGDAWIGCNHGVALVGVNYGVEEHHHPTLCLWDAATFTCSLKVGDVPAVAFTSDGALWFGGGYGVMKLEYERSNGSGQFWGPEPVRNTSLWDAPLGGSAHGSEDIVGLAVEADGTLWAASRHSGLARRSDDGTIRHFQEADGLVSNRLEDLAIDDAGLLWIATATQGLVRLDPSTGEWRRVPGLPSLLARRVVAEDTGAGFLITAVVRNAVVVYRGAP